MAVHVPAMVVVGALKAVQNQANNQQERSMASMQLKRDTLALRRLEMELDSADERHARSLRAADRQHERELAAEDRQRDRQLAAFRRLTDLSEKTAKMKVEAYLEIFRDVRDVLRDQQQIYGDELREITKMSFSASSEGNVLINKRKAEIDKELQGIRTAITENAKAAYTVISTVYPELPKKARSALENLTDD